MENLEELRKKRLIELQNQLNEKRMVEEQQQIIRKRYMFKYLTKEARERLNRVKLAHPDIAERVEIAIIQTVQTGAIKEINDEQLKQILQELSQDKKGFVIRK